MASQAKVGRMENAGTEALMLAVQKIDEIQESIDKINDEASEEILKVEQRFNKMRQPHYVERAEIISRIPRFWVTCFLHHPQISSILNEDDERSLAHLLKLEVQEFDDIKSGYKISLHFEKNPFFSNDVISKEFHLGEGGEPTFSNTPINWHPGKEPAATHSANGKQTAGAKRALPCEVTEGGFFAWFEEKDPLAAEVGEIIKDDLWPNPLQYYLNHELEGEDEEEEEEDENTEEDIEGDEEAIEDEEEDA